MGDHRRMFSRNRCLCLLARFLWLGAVLVAFASVIVAVNLRSPYLLAVRETAFRGWLVAGFLALGFLIFRGRRISAAPHLIAVADRKSVV